MATTRGAKQDGETGEDEEDGGRGWEAEINTDERCSPDIEK